MHDIDMLLGNKVSNKGQHAVRRYPGAGQCDFFVSVQGKSHDVGLFHPYSECRSGFHML